MSQEFYFGEVDVRRFDRFESLLERIASKLEESAPSASNNSDYAAALKLAREYLNSDVPSHSVGDFVYQLEQRLNPTKAADCA